MSMEDTNSPTPDQECPAPISFAQDNNFQSILPQEVMDSIIDALSDLSLDGRDKESWKTLARCLLVSRSFYDRARPHIFRSIIRKEQFLPCENWDDRRDNLFFEIFEGDLLREYSPLAKQVREIILLACFPTTARMAVFESWSISQRELDRRRQLFPRVLRHMANLDTFEFRTEEKKGRPLNWNLLHLEMKLAIKNICCFVRVLRFDNVWELPLSLLGVCEKLEELFLSRIGHFQFGLADWKHPAFDNLAYLEIGEVASGLIPKIMEHRPKAFSKLRHFKISLPPKLGYAGTSHLESECAVLQASAESLQILEVFSPTSQFFFPPHTASKLTSLHTLRLRSTISSLLPEYFPPEMMSFFIKDIAAESPSSLLELNLEIHLEAPKLTVADRRDIIPAEWQRCWTKLDTLLAGPSYPLLERLNIRFYERQPTPIDREESELLDNETLQSIGLAWLSEYIEGALPKVYASSTIMLQLEYRIFEGAHSQFPCWERS